ncbi:MAG: replicative DNA helicase [Pedosphaera sp. Tous-C6FEB]|nr:MAG: replicative DNA helicase [Pedosphaera sp. Tous-C6FEB]
MSAEPPAPPADLKRTRRRKDAAIDLAKLDRLPPHSLEAEQGVLGCMLLDPNAAIGTCIEKFKSRRDSGEPPKKRFDEPPPSPHAGASAAFYDLRHQSIYETLVTMYDAKEAIDIITVRQQLQDRGQLDAIGGVAYLTALQDATPSAANLPYYADIVVEKHLLRRMIATCTSVIGRIYDEQQQGDVESLLDEVEKEVLHISEEREETVSLVIKDLVHKAIAQIEEMHSRQGQTTGLPTGFTDLDKMTTGFHPGDMIVIAARPSMGKTSLAMNIAEHVAMDAKLPVGVFSLEMSADSLVLRMLCSRAHVNLRDIREGFMAERDFPKLTNVAGKMAGAPLFIDDTASLSILQLRAKARRMHQQHGIKLFVIDYLQLLRSTAKRAENRQQEIADISQGIKALAKELKVPIIVLAQLNRELEKREPGAKPKLSDLRESGSIEQDADLVGLLYKPKLGKDDDEEPPDPSTFDAVPVNFLIAKQRNGPTGDVHLTFLKGFTRFESAAKVAGEDAPED